MDMDNFGRVAKIFIDPKANEAYVADGYFNQRVAVIDLDSGKIKRIWGAYGKPPTDVNLGRYDPERAARRSSSATRCTAPRCRTTAWSTSCDRPNDRVQIFTKRRQVREGSVRPDRHAGRRLGVGHRLLEGPAAALPLHG